MDANNKHLTEAQKQEQLATLKARFAQNMQRHTGLAWNDVQTRLEKDPAKLWTLHEMEATGGEPDVVSRDEATRAFLFFDCSPETPAGRRNLCYDDAALAARKANKPQGSAAGMAAAMGIHLLTEEQYHMLQTLGAFDVKTSSWISTPDTIRKRGGALFGDRRYDHVFVYHNGAESYYSVRGFRGAVLV